MFQNFLKCHVYLNLSTNVKDISTPISFHLTVFWFLVIVLGRDRFCSKYNVCKLVSCVISEDIYSSWFDSKYNCLKFVNFDIPEGTVLISLLLAINHVNDLLDSNISLNKHHIPITKHRNQPEGEIWSCFDYNTASPNYSTSLWKKGAQSGDNLSNTILWLIAVFLDLHCWKYPPTYFQTNLDDYMMFTTTPPIYNNYQETPNNQSKNKQ